MAGEQNAQKSSASLATELAREALAARVPAGWFVDAQEPITTTDSEPEPDVVVVLGKRRDYAKRHPGPDDIVLVVEVADTSLQRERSAKKRLYAVVGIAEYWIINLPDNQLEQYTGPQPDSDPPDYQQQRIYGLDEEIVFMLAGKKRRLKIRDVLP